MRITEKPYKVVGTCLHYSGHYDFPSGPNNKVYWCMDLKEAVAWALWERTIGTKDLFILERGIKLEAISNLIDKEEIECHASGKYRAPSDDYFALKADNIINKQVI